VALAIERVDTRRQLADFITLPRRLYSGMPGYVAPLDHDRRQMLDPKKAAFFTHGEAAYWIAARAGRQIGRVSAQIDRASEGPAAQEIGLFGCLDTVDDAECVAALLGTAAAWLRERGRRTMRGPFLLSINGESGLLVEGQSLPPVTMLPWHPAYLDRLVQEAGCSPVTALHCFQCNEDEFTFDQTLEELAKIRCRAEITVRDLRLGQLDAEMEVARQIYNDGWRRNWGFTPATKADVHAMATEFKPFLFSDTTFFVDVRGEPAAFMVAIPNIFEITADLGPAPSAFGWAKLLFRIWRQHYRCFRVILLGMVSKYQNSALGAAIATVIFDEVRRRLRARHAAECVLAWVVESNHIPLKAVKSLGFRHTQRYSVYERTLIG